MRKFPACGIAANPLYAARVPASDSNQATLVDDVYSSVKFQSRYSRESGVQSPVFGFPLSRE
jgi:hypothetical protein